ncbi:hypothetical protein BC826DRAFT_978271 [Russula brevipes]|nr:hypothetical protein BC826DRAFT_978271 [Russula brevipes]
MADDARSLAPRRRPHRPILVVANPGPDSDSDSANEPSTRSAYYFPYSHNDPPSPSPPSPSIDKSFPIQLASSREPGPLTTTNLPSHSRPHPASQSNPALSSPSGTSSPPPSTPGQSLPPTDFTRFSVGPSLSSDALVQQQHTPLHATSAGHLLSKVKAHIPRFHHDRRLSGSSRPTSSPTNTTPSEPDANRAVNNDGRSPPPDKSLTRIFVTGDSDQYYTVDITGFRNADFIKELIFSKLRIEDEEQSRYSIYRTEIGSYALGDAVPDEQLYELCRDHGDERGSLKFLVANSSAVVHEQNQPLPATSPTVNSIQPPVLIPSSNSVYNRPHPRPRSHSRHGSVSSASERPEVVNGFDISPSDDQNGADAESHRSTLHLVPPSPRGSRKPAEPRNGSPARSNTHRSGPHSPDTRRGRPSPYTTQHQPRAIQPSPERSRPVCDDRPFSGAPGTSPHTRSGSDGLDSPRGGTGIKDLEAIKLTREPSWEGTRLPRVGRDKSSPRYPPSNTALQQPPPPPGGDREQRGSGRAWKPVTGDPSSPGPHMDNLRDKGRPRPTVVPPLPSISGLDVTPTSQTTNGDSVGSSSQREVEPSRPILRTSPTNSRPIRPLPQQTSGQSVPEVAPRLPFPTGMCTPTNSTQGLLPTPSDPVTRPRSVLDEESTSPSAPPPHPLRLPRPPLQESDILRSPLPLPHPPRYPPPPRQDDSAPRALPIPGRAPAMDDRSSDARSGSLIDGNSTPADRTPPRSPVSPRKRFGPRPDLTAAASATANSIVSADSRDLIDFHRPAEQTITQDDKTLRDIQHLLDGQSSSDEAPTIMKPKVTIRNIIGYIPVTPTESIYSPPPLTPDNHPSDQDGSDSEAGTLWQKPMIEEDSLAERPKSAIKIDEHSTSSGGGLTLIPNSFPPPPKHPPPSPPLPHWGTRTPTSRHLHRVQAKAEGTFQDSSWASRPNPEEVLNRLEVFFPDHDLDKPVIEASSGGTPPAPLPYNGKSAADKRSRHKKQDRTSRLQSSSAANVFRKRSTKLWDSRVEEVTPGQITSGMPSIPDSPSASGPGTPAPKPIFKWVRGELIGKGNFGRVYLALNATTGEMIAVKQVEIPRTASDKNDTRQVTVVEALKLESETLKDLDHPNIVQYLGFEETPNFLSIFLEYVPGGSVGSCLRKYGRFEENVTKYFTEQILSGLEYLHSKGILHRDLKADNILVEKTGRTDDIDEQNVLTAMQGTVFWMAPEVVNTGKRGYNSKVDIWSVGCVVLEMWAGERPWRKEEAMAVIVKLYSSKQAPPIPSGITLSSQADDFRRKCFAIDPSERPSAAELRKHLYLGRPQGWGFSDFGGSHMTRDDSDDD